MAAEALTKSGQELVKVLRKKGKCTQKELIGIVDIPARTVRYALKRLIELGIIYRRSNLNDMRSVYYFLAE